MKTIKDLVDFLSKLDGDYPIPYVDKIVGANEDELDVEDYSLSWGSISDGSYVDCSFFKQKDGSYNVSIYTYYPGKYNTIHNTTSLDATSKLEECLRELYGTN